MILLINVFLLKVNSGLKVILLRRTYLNVEPTGNDGDWFKSLSESTASGSPTISGHVAKERRK